MKSLSSHLKKAKKGEDITYLRAYSALYLVSHFQTFCAGGGELMLSIEIVIVSVLCFCI